MGFSAFYSGAKRTTDEAAVQVFHTAIDAGVTLFNTANFYGPLNEIGFGENLRLIKKCLHGIDRSKIQLMIKIGMDTKASVDATGLHLSVRYISRVISVRKITTHGTRVANCTLLLPT